MGSRPPQRVPLSSRKVAAVVNNSEGAPSEFMTVNNGLSNAKFSPFVPSPDPAKMYSVNASQFANNSPAITIGEQAFPSFAAKDAAGLDTIPEGQRIILRPVEIQFPAKGLSPAEQELFACILRNKKRRLIDSR